MNLRNVFVKCLSVLGDIMRKEFQSDQGAEIGVFRLVDHSHPVAAKLLDDAVVRNGVADQSWRGCPGRFILRTRHGRVNEGRRRWLSLIFGLGFSQ